MTRLCPMHHVHPPTGSVAVKVGLGQGRHMAGTCRPHDPVSECVRLHEASPERVHVGVRSLPPTRPPSLAREPGSSPARWARAC